MDKTIYLESGLDAIKGWLDHEFSTGTVPGQDYLLFQEGFITFIKDLCYENDAEVTRILRGHYELSLFIKKDGKYTYIAIPDVRGNQDWYYHLLFRFARSDKDLNSGRNRYVSLDVLTRDFNKLLRR